MEVLTAMPGSPGTGQWATRHGDGLEALGSGEKPL
jgi:hypothetical protein